MEATKTIEAKILSVIRRQSNFYKYIPILNISFFSQGVTRQIFGMIEGYFNTHESSKLKLSDLKYLVIKNITNKDLKEETLKLVKSLRGYNSKDSKVVEETIKDFAKRQLVRTVIIESLELLEEPNPDFSTIQEKLDRAVHLSTETEVDYYNYFDDPEGRVELEDNEKKFPFGIPKLDEALKGGMCAGELLVFLGPPGRGKTLALVNIGAASLMQGLVVCHVTLEISDRKVARRYDTRITGKSFDVLRNSPSKVSKRLASIKKLGGELIIKDFSMEHPSVDDVKSHLINWQNRNKRKVDILIIDYGDLMKSKHRNQESRHDLEEVYTDLRRLARQFGIPVYTASQATRKSLTKPLVTMEDVAESFGKVKVADVVLGLCQTPEELEEDLIRVFIAKSRKQKGNPVIRLACEPNTMYLGEHSHGKQTDLGFIRGNKKNN